MNATLVDRTDWSPDVSLMWFRCRSESDRPARGTEVIDDAELMRLFRKGDEQAFRRLYDRYRGPLWRYVLQSSESTQEAEEVVQETWLAIIRGRERYQPTARFVTFLFSIARRRGVDRWRRRGREIELEPDVELDRLPGPSSLRPEPAADFEELRNAFARALEALPMLQREAFLLRAETDLSVEEIAQITNTGHETVKSRLRYAMDRLRRALEPWS
jgi:RNA polymerase sigma-70 factor, ECF subfamily